MSFRAFVATAAAVASASCAPELNWREVRAEEAGARLLFPCRPVRQKREIDLGGRSRAMVLHACDAGSVSWALALVQLHSEEEREGVERALSEAVRANMSADAPGAESPPSLPGRAAQVAAHHWRGRAPDGRAIEAVSAFGGRPGSGWLAQVTAVGPVVPRDAAEAFVDSMRFDS